MSILHTLKYYTSKSLDRSIGACRLLQVHTPALCVEEALPSAINGFDTDEAIEYGQLKSGHLFLGWLKGFVGQRVIELGHKTLLLDTDIVFFSNPIADFLKTKADLIISSDCDNLYHPKHSRLASPLSLMYASL